MYEYLQYAHIAVFAALIPFSGWRVTGLVLVLSAIAYISLEPIFNYWNQTTNIKPFIVRMAIDSICAQILFRHGGAHGMRQAGILSALFFCHLLSALELYTPYAFMYNSYVNLTRLGNVLQLLLGGAGLMHAYRDFKKRMADNNCHHGINT